MTHSSSRKLPELPERESYILRRLGELYPNPPLPLHHKNPYTLLISVVLSARCTDARVNLTTPKLFALADTPEAMMKLPVSTVQEIIRPCGLSPAKARGIVELSRILVERYGGEVPADFAALEELPAVGHKTASVVMVQAFHVPAFPVDTHIYRLARRWGISEGKSVDRVEKDLKAAFPPETWHDLHLQMIYYGREHCTARGCGQKHHCEICTWCGRPRPVT